jgi:hypothetical protein
MVRMVTSFSRLPFKTPRDIDIIISVCFNGGGNAGRLNIGGQKKTCLSYLTMMTINSSKKEKPLYSVLGTNHISGFPRSRE